MIHPSETSPRRGVVDDPALARLWESAHHRIEREGGIKGAHVTLKDPADDERRSLDMLLGRRSRARHPRISLEALDAELVARTGCDLQTVVTRHVGPLRDLPAERRSRDETEEAFWLRASQHPAVARQSLLGGWLDQLRATGRIKREHDPTALIAALDVLATLPAEPPASRPALAARVLGDAHALDDSRAACRLVLDALTWTKGLPTPKRAVARRRVLESVGIITDATTSTALTLALPVVPAGPCTQGAAVWAAGGTPLIVPLAATVAEPWRVPAGTVVWVCENPTVLETAALCLDPAPPMVCVQGVPTVAAQELLRSLIESGAVLRYHGDFGAGGIAIGNIVIGELGAQPWRFDTDSHARVLALLQRSGTSLPALADRVPEASWDGSLAGAIRKCRVEIEEEHVLDTLLDDMRSSG